MTQPPFQTAVTPNIPDEQRREAIDELTSVSRVMRDVAAPEHVKVRGQAIDIISAYRSAEDMISIGAYVDGSDPKIDQAKQLMPAVNEFLKQDMGKKNKLSLGVSELSSILNVKTSPGKKR